jgi:hypothetical protein
LFAAALALRVDVLRIIVPGLGLIAVVAPVSRRNLA